MAGIGPAKAARLAAAFELTRRLRARTPGQRLVLPVARHAPALGGWFLGRLAALARRSPGLFLRLATSGLSGIDRRALAYPKQPAQFRRAGMHECRGRRMRRSGFRKRRARWRGRQLRPR